MKLCPHQSPVLLCGLCAALVLPACGKLRFGGTKSQDDVINALRAENHALKKDVAAKDGRIAELEGKVTGPLNAGALRALPTVATMEIDRLSGMEPARNRAAGSVVIYLKTLDGLGRFVQVTGEVDVQVSLDGESGSTGRVITRSYTPEEVRAAFRSGFMGTFYVFRLPFDGPAAANPRSTISVVLQDAVTGKSHTATRQVGDAQTAERPATTGKQGG